MLGDIIVTVRKRYILIQKVLHTRGDLGVGVVKNE